MAVIQGGGITYDRGAATRQNLSNLAGSIAQARSTRVQEKSNQLQEQATKLQEQRDSLARYTTLLESIPKYAELANMPVSVFVRDKAGAGVMNQMFAEYGRATGNQLTPDEALKMSTDVVELYNNPDFIDRYTTDWFGAQYQSPTGQAVEVEKPPVPTGNTLGAKSGGTGGGSVKSPGVVPEEGGTSSVAPAQLTAAPAFIPTGNELTVNGQAYISPNRAKIGEALYGMLATPDVVPQDLLTFYRYKTGDDSILQLMPKEQNSYIARWLETNPDMVVAWGQEQPRTVLGSDQRTQSDQVKPASPDITGGAGSTPVTSIENIPMPAQTGASLMMPGTGVPAPGPMFKEKQIDQTNPPSQPQEKPLGSQGVQYGASPPFGASATALAEYYQREFFKLKNGRDPTDQKEAFNFGMKNASEFQKFQKDPKSYQGVKTISGGVDWSKVPVALTEAEIWSALPGVPKFVASTTVNMVTKAQSPTEAAVRAMANDKSMQALENFQLDVSDRPTPEAPQKVVQSATNAGEVVMKATSGQPLSTRDQMLLKQQSAIAGNWYNTVWSKMSDQDKMATAKRIATEVSTLPAAFLELRYPGRKISDFRSAMEQIQSQLDIAALKAMSESSGDPTLKEWATILETARKTIDDRLNYDTGIINGPAYKGDAAKYYLDNPQAKSDLALAQKSYDTITEGMRISGGPRADWTPEQKSLLQRILTGKRYEIILGQSNTGAVNKGETTASPGQEVGSQYKVTP